MAEEGVGVGHGKYGSWEAAASHPGPEMCQRTEALSQSQEERGSPKKEAWAEAVVAAVDGDEIEKGNL